ncbi:MAG TPA: hypothetical protein VM536_00400 [Chloroflexia bacterium]|nr:hypothetical protein [Chloroflexia bacterium]
MEQELAIGHSNPPTAAHSYGLSPDARRTALALLLGVAAIALFAIWNLAAQLTGGLEGPEWVTAALMLAILVLSPAVGWALLAERAATITTDEAGLTYHTAGGVQLTYPWAEVGGLAPATSGFFSFGDKARSAGRTAEPAADPAQSMVPPAANLEMTETGADPDATWHLTVARPALERITNPLVRLLHQQAHGGKVPIYAGLADRADLLAEIRRRAPVAT